MNAAQETQLPLSDPLPGAASGQDHAHAALSALVDGELHTEEEWAQCLALADHPAGDWETHWASYHVIGEVLRGSEQLPGTQKPADFLAAVRGRLAAEDVARPVVPSGRLQPERPVQIGGHVRPDAANDPVFRWKLLAGVASLAAVMAVSWSLLGTLPGSPAANTAGAQLAQAGSDARAGAQVGVVAAGAGQALVVQTPQGPVIRDAQLEERLAEHRQYGGMSALQMPAGFLRNATYDAPAR